MSEIESITGALDPPTVAEEITRRQTYTDKLLALFRSRPMEWIDVRELAAVGGFAAWRSRVVEVRDVLHAQAAAGQPSGTIEWNHHNHASAYRFLPYTPLARDAGTRTAQPSLF